ncbi:hypothetical protein B0H13DRAFT_2045789 [Mycena leptocephala]|nr:hypothetical protein B0H13DRAFT_2045789 [Mycena leptocephala]
MSPQLIQLLHAYPLLYDVDKGQHPALNELRPVLGHSWDELRTIICPLRGLVSQENTALELLFLSVSHRTRIHELHPDPTLVHMAHGAMRSMTNLTICQLPKKFYAAAPCWGCVLRSCPPDPDLLNTLLETERSSAISDPSRPLNKANIHNVIEWLKTFPEPPWDLIARIQGLLPDSDRRRDFIGQDLEQFWAAWKERTGW